MNKKIITTSRQRKSYAEKSMMQPLEKISQRKIAILYTRTASIDENSSSNSQRWQEEELRNYCKLKDIEVAHVVHDFGSGIDFDKRKEFRPFYEKLKSGEYKADLLLFTTFDRLSRNLVAFNEMFRQLQTLGIQPQSIQACDARLLHFLSRLK